MNALPRLFGCRSSPSFALISVLALVSLAALTATAFLASARLDRRATIPLSQSTLLEMALSAGANAARDMVDYAPSKHFNFVTTYWRGTNAGDWTNELGYLLSGAVQSTSSKTSRIYNYYACFSTATMKKLGTNATDLVTVSNNVDNQGTFPTQIATFMAAMTNNFVANPTATDTNCTRIPLLGGITSPPVGWVYIDQDKRDAKTGKTNSVPVARFAFFVQDLCGMIDAERMGGFTNGTPFRASTALPPAYTPGTNPMEISLANLTGTTLTDNSKAQSFTAASNRIRYLTPGTLLSSQIGGLSSNDLRYVTTGLRHWTNAWERIPVGLGYRDSWTNKLVLSSTNINDTNFVRTNFLAQIVRNISNNIPAFTNRAGGMNGTSYLYALAANIVDYADNNSSATQTNVNGVNILGFDNYPLVTQIFDKFEYDNVNTTIQMTTYLQFWNLSSQPTPSLTGGNLTYDFRDTIAYTGTDNLPYTKRLAPAIMTATFSFAVPPAPSFSFPANSGFITSIVWPKFDLKVNADFPQFKLGESANNFKLNSPSAAASTDDPNVINSITITGIGASITPAVSFKHGNMSLNNPPFTSANPPSWRGTIFCDAYNVAGITPQPRLSADPRMITYIGVGAAAARSYEMDYKNIFWKGYPYYRVIVDPTKTNHYSGYPGNWYDGQNTANANLPARGSINIEFVSPAYGPFNMCDPVDTSIIDAPFCKISNRGIYTNICELSSIFDPIQWSPPADSNKYNYANADIPSGTTWTTNNFYGGGATLRIGRPEHSRFAFTNLAGASVATPNMEQSAAALLDLFCATNSSDESGQINLNTAPAPVLRALAGKVFLRSDPSIPNTPVPDSMAEAFAQGVMRFRHRYPFYSPSQLCFIGTDPGWPNTNSWPANAVFGNQGNILLQANAPGNTSGGNASMGALAWNDQAAEEWFSKIYKLSTTFTRNFRVYVVAQLVNTNREGTSPIVRKYYNVCTRQNTDKETDVPPASASTFDVYSAPY